MRGSIREEMGQTAVRGAVDRQGRWRSPARAGRWQIVGGLGLALLALPAGGVSAQNTSPLHQETHAALVNLQDAFSVIADEMEPAVVTVFSTKAFRSADGDSNDIPRGVIPFGRRSRRSTGTGSGVLVSKDGWILTNDHVVDGADRVTVRLHDGREFTGTVRRDFRSDLALVKIAASTPFPAARLGDSDKVKIGHWAIAIGSPYKYEGSFSVGVISSLYRSQQIFDLNSLGSQRFYPNMIQTDAAINPGNSGGPLCDIDGEVIGINTAIESEGGGSVGIGFAIPINTAKFVIAQLRDKGHVTYGYLGISPTSVTPRTASALKVEAGALIDQEPEASTPGAKAGLHAGDVVTAINGKGIHNELDLRTLVAQTPPGTTIDLTVMRDGHPQALKATLGQAPDPVQERPHEPGKTHLGIDVQPLTKKLAEQAQVPTDTPGVVIKAIDPASSVADEKDLGEGDIILRVNDTATTTVQAFQTATASLKSGDQVRLVYQHQGIKRFAVVTVD